MGTRATIYQISSLAVQAAIDGDFESFGNHDIGEPLHIDKAWHAIYYLLTGDTELLLFPGGTAIELMSEYSEVHSPESTANISYLLKNAVETHEVQGLDMAALSENKIYPRDWQDENPDYVKSNLDALSRFVETAVNRKNGLFVIIA